MSKASAAALAAAGEKYLGRSYEEMDCQKFVETCMKDVGVRMDLAGSNAWFRYCMEKGWTGTPEECTAKYGLVPDGALLFILDKNGKEPAKYQGDGIGNASHIGLCTGRLGTGAIHSSQSKGCVCWSAFSGRTVKNGGWNRVGLLPGLFDYGGKVQEEKPKEAGEKTVGEWKSATVISGNGGPVNLRVQPDVNSARLAKVPTGTVVQIQEEQNGWCPVMFGSQTGWMMAIYLERETAEVVKIPKAELERIYDTIGGWLGLRG